MMEGYVKGWWGNAGEVRERMVGQCWGVREKTVGAMLEGYVKGLWGNAGGVCERKVGQ